MEVVSLKEKLVQREALLDQLMREAHMAYDATNPIGSQLSSPEKKKQYEGLVIIIVNAVLTLF